MMLNRMQLLLFSLAVLTVGTVNAAGAVELTQVRASDCESVA